MTLDDSIHNRQGSFLFDFCIKHHHWTSLSTDCPISAFLLPFSEKIVDVSLSLYVLYKGRKRDQKNGLAQLYGKGITGCFCISFVPTGYHVYLKKTSWKIV